MARAIVWAGRARADLRISAEYIRKASPAAARAFVSAALQAARSLSECPERGRVVPDVDDPEVRDLLLALGRRSREEAERQVAKLIGTSQPYVAKLESGRVKNLGIGTLVKYAHPTAARRTRRKKAG